MGASNPMASLFGKSPFKSIQEHMRVVLECAKMTSPLMQALTDSDDVLIDKYRQAITDLELEADNIKHALRARLPKSLLMPVDRRDLLEILDLQDNIADTTQDIAELMVDRSMSIPEVMKKPILNLVERSIDTCAQAAKTIEALDELVQVGFSGREADRVMELVAELNKIETETDRLEVAAVRTLFAHEGELKPVSVVFWYRLIEWIAALSDYAEKIGNRLRLLVAR
ncbi:MAG: TIGR00153 family protein [Magnetococcales bacterium]|nr:TIGR00153 family protein [Magnetococcales bacterium]